MIKGFFAILLSLTSLQLVARDRQDIDFTFPMTFHVNEGIYTVPLLIGQPPQEVEAIVDTGSSSLVVIPSGKVCSNCANALTKGGVDIKSLIPYQSKKTHHLNYGSSIDEVLEYEAPVTGTMLKTTLIPNMQLFVLKSSSQPSTILGMLRENLTQVKSAATFLNKLHAYYKYHRVLTLVMCGINAKSYITFGTEKVSAVAREQGFNSPITHEYFYEIQTSGFFDANGVQIVKPIQKFVAAILDSGTGGYIILNKFLLDQTRTYLYNHAGKTNQALGDKFWKQNYCAPMTAIDFKALPNIKIGFQKKEDLNSYYLLDLPPKAYISHAGCDAQSARFVFMASLPPHPTATAIRNQKQREALKYFPSMILGSSFLNQYVTRLHLTDVNSYVTFYSSDTLCHRK